MYEAAYAKTATSQKGTLPSARLCKNVKNSYLDRKVRKSCFGMKLLLGKQDILPGEVITA